MSEYHDNEELLEDQEAITEREVEAQEVLRDTSRTKITRIHTGSKNVESQTEGEPIEEGATEEKKSWWRSLLSLISSFATGRILVHDETKKIYNLFILLGAIFLASILTIFAHLQKDLQWSKLHKEVETLRDRATRTSELRIERTSHSAILRQLKERNIDLQDPQTPPSTLK